MLTKIDTLKYVAITAIVIGLFVFLIRYVNEAYIIVILVGVGFLIYFSYIVYFKPRIAKGNITSLPPETQLLWKDTNVKGNKISKGKHFQEELSIYKTGIHFFNFFYRWDHINQLFFSKQIKGGKAVSNTLLVLDKMDGSQRLAPDTTTTLTIRIKKNKSYFIDIADIDGFNIAIKKLKKEDLLQ